MARVETVLSELPRLISDRNDSRKVELAVRYVGDILFDASQNRRGEKANWLGKVLRSPISVEESHARGAILALFRDGYLDRYSDFAAWADIVAEAGISLSQRSPDSATAASPKIVSLTQVFNAPNSPLPPRSKPSSPASETVVKADGTPKQRTPYNSKDRAIREGGARAESAAQLRRGEYQELPKLTQAAHTSGDSSPLEITCLGATAHDPFLFAKNFKPSVQASAENFFPCLAGFQPSLSFGRHPVEWVNPITGDRFVDHGRRLTSTSPSRLALRAMLELARAENWISVSVQGSLRLQTLAEATASEIDRATRILARNADHAPRPPESQRTGARSRNRPKRRWKSFAYVCFFLILGTSSFGATMFYQSPALRQRAVDLTNQLPWRRAVRLAEAKDRPLALSKIDFALSTNGDSFDSPLTNHFTDIQIAKANFLKWSAVLQNKLEGLQDQEADIELRIYDSNHSMVASSFYTIAVEQSQKIADASGSIATASFVGRPFGEYTVDVSANNNVIARRSLVIAEDFVQKEWLRQQAEEQAAREQQAREQEALAKEQAAVEEQRRIAEEQEKTRQAEFARQEEERRRRYEFQQRQIAEQKTQQQQAAKEQRLMEQRELKALQDAQRQRDEEMRVAQERAAQQQAAAQQQYAQQVQQQQQQQTVNQLLGSGWSFATMARSLIPR
jgi:hypothetical protein